MMMLIGYVFLFRMLLDMQFAEVIKWRILELLMFNWMLSEWITSWLTDSHTKWKRLRSVV
jgi:hypothetical protein